jgi:DNA-binding HxlR family transcriptional regulator
MNLEALEQTSLPRILTYLLRVKRASRSDLKNNIRASQQAIYNALPILLRNGLIEERQSDTFPFRIEVTLTEKGRRVAALLAEIEKIMKEEE